MPEHPAASDEPEGRALTPGDPEWSAASPVEMSSTMQGAYQTVLEKHTRPTTAHHAEPALPLPMKWLVAAGCSVAALVIVLLAPPSFARPPAVRAFETPPTLREASLRFGLYLAHARVEAFIRAQHRLPSFAAEAGVDDPSITLSASGERQYSLIGHEGAATLTLVRGMSPDSFLGDAAVRLAADPAYQQATAPAFATAR